MPNMSSCRSPCFIFVLFLLLSQATSCTPLAEEVSSEQLRYICYQQRGLPREFIEPFFEDFLEVIYKYVQHRYGKLEFSSICLTLKDLNEFYGSIYDGSAIDREVENLIKMFPDIAYISQTEQKYIPYDTRLQRSSMKSFNSTFEKLSQGNVTGAATLPKTSEVFFDPKRGENLVVYNAHASHAPMMPALRLLRIVTGMVVTLELAEVSREHSTQLLRHAVAWLSNVFRALQKDGSDVVVPVLFIPFYEEEFHRLMKYGRHKVPVVTEYHVEKELGNELAVYCRLNAWGKLEIVNWLGTEPADTWTIETILFHPSFLANMARRIGFHDFDSRNYPPFDPEGEGKMDGSEVEYRISNNWYDTQGPIPMETYRMAVPATYPMLNASVRQTDGCILPAYTFFSRPGTTWEQKCCASICFNAVLMMQISLSIQDCCGDCNQAFCQVGGTPLDNLATVHLQPYGFDCGGSVPVSL